MFAKIENDTLVKYPYSFTDLQNDNPTVSFPMVSDLAVYSEYGIVNVEHTEPPSFDYVYQNLVERDPIKAGDSWVQVWEIADASPDEIKTRVPVEISMRQTRLILLINNKLADVNNLIQSMTGVEGEAARIEWEYATSISFNSPLVQTLCDALNITEEQKIQLFVDGSRL